ncbi:hypothetical protein [Cellulomonas sp. PSBB021]|uniref:hypothetical protein n=1 Tax=Cellulomonas sp. PSBB021 TaxID=2003551 RepID=UPI000A88C7BD|nr:hypothetical protein [Cellulomonas sp. PSBB021]ASR56213.1 hypothetical protein CBP52_15155 [Cellulomonas sp. PSBB021]
MKKSTSAAVGISTVMLLGLGAAVLAPSYGASGDDDAAATKPQSATINATTSPKVCDGGVQKRLQARTQVEPFSFAGTAGADRNVPGAGVVVYGPATGYDTLLITFSAETYYTGTGWLGLEVHDNNVPIQPYANNGSPYAFTSEAKYTGNSVQFCTKVKKGTHRIQVKVNTTGDATTDSGWIDDWTLSVLRFE